MRVEILRGQATPNRNDAILDAMADAIHVDGHQVIHTKRYEGKSDLLMLFGIGFPDHDLARRHQIKAGKRAVHWDLAYFGNPSRSTYRRFCIDVDHPQSFLDSVIAKPDRWDAQGIDLRDDYLFAGPVLLIGLGPKSRDYLNLHNWERKKLNYIRNRFEGREVIFRPKRWVPPGIDVKKDRTSTIEELLNGAFRVICRHSNCAVDAVIAGVPFEAEDGAAMWLVDKPFTVENRLDFLRRLSYFQWRNDEAADAWTFIKGLL